MKIKIIFLLICTITTANALADTVDILLQNTVNQNACVFSNMGIYDGGITMIPVYENIIYHCDPGYYLPKMSEICSLCPSDSYCPGGEYEYSEKYSQGIIVCPDGLFAPVGMWGTEQCGRKLHVGNDVVYARSVKKTEPALNLDIDMDGVADFYINMTTADVPMNNKTERKLKIRYGDIIYSVYDDSIELNK